VEQEEQEEEQDSLKKPLRFAYDSLIILYNFYITSLITFHITFHITSSFLSSDRFPSQPRLLLKTLMSIISLISRL